MFEASVQDGTAVTGPVHWTTMLAALPAPAPFDATSMYCFWPATVTVSVQLGPLDEQPVHVKFVGLFVHDAEIVSVDPVCGARLLAESVHDGTGAPDCQFTARYAMPPVPAAFDADTEYVTEPGVDDVAAHWMAEQVKPVHVNVVGLPVQDADRTTCVLTSGAELLAMTEQLGIGSLPPPPPPPPPLFCRHSTSTAARGPVPALLPAAIA